MDYHKTQSISCNDDSESGRSLVEMLGVLAVMGILTIGGIAGFNYAMNKQRANATVNYVNQLALEGSRQMLAGSNHLSLLDYPDKTPSGYGVELRLLKDTNAYFEVYVQDVPEAVCSQIQAMAEGWRGLDTLWINEDGKDCNKETNTMSFIFTDSLSRGTSGTRCTSDEGCSGCQTCQSGFCSDTDSACPGNTPHCVSGSCEKCPAGEFQDSRGKCYKCNESKTFWLDNKAECDKCLGTRVCSGITSYPCDTKGTIYWPRKEVCQACRNRYVSLVVDIGVACDYCDGTIITAENGAQFCQGNCPEGEFWWKSKCVKCDDVYTSTPYGILKSECISKCKGTRFFQASGNQCRHCDVASPAYWSADRESCLACPNRYIDSNNTCHLCTGEMSIDAKGNRLCLREECPAGQIWSSLGCQPCDTTEALWDTTRTDCASCGNRYMARNGDGSCRFCAGTVNEDRTACITE